MILVMHFFVASQSVRFTQQIEVRRRLNDGVQTGGVGIDVGTQHVRLLACAVPAPVMRTSNMKPVSFLYDGVGGGGLRVRKQRQVSTETISLLQNDPLRLKRSWSLLWMVASTLWGFAITLMLGAMMVKPVEAGHAMRHV